MLEFLQFDGFSIGRIAWCDTIVKILYKLIEIRKTLNIVLVQV